MDKQVTDPPQGWADQDLISVARAVERDFTGLIQMLDCQLYVGSDEEICTIVKAKAAAERGLQLSRRLSDLTTIVATSTAGRC